ncbi:MAG TPA: hypothetical protein VFG50_07570 [Rhodothermales bacterium]|nr:hypothetical protein [Rhodothermales bacterium]
MTSLVVGPAMQQHRPTLIERAAVAGWAVDVGGQAHAVAHGDHRARGQVDVELVTGGAGGQVDGRHQAAWSLAQRLAGRPH